MNRLHAWFRKQQRRDQLALTVLAAALFLYLLLQGLLRPLQQRLDDAAQRVANAEQSLTEVKAMAARLAEYRSGTATEAASAASLASRVDSSSAGLGLALTSLEPSADGSSAAVRLDEVALGQLLRWLQQLQDAQIHVESLDLAPGKEPGQVSALLRLGIARAGGN